MIHNLRPKNCTLTANIPHATAHRQHTNKAHLYFTSTVNASFLPYYLLIYLSPIHFNKKKTSRYPVIWLDTLLTHFVFFCPSMYLNSSLAIRRYMFDTSDVIILTTEPKQLQHTAIARMLHEDLLSQLHSKNLRKSCGCSLDSEPVLKPCVTTGSSISSNRV